MTDRPPRRGTPGTAWNDPKVPGLRLRHLETKSVWYLFVRTKAGTQRNIKIGDETAISLTKAREMANDIRRQIAEGKDPAAEARAMAQRPTMRDLAMRHMEEHAGPKLKPSTVEAQRLQWEKHILPAMGDKAVADITSADIAALHHRMRKTPYQANRTVALLSKAFKLAERWGWRERRSNPVDVDRFAEQKRRRLPTGDEPIRLMLAMERMRQAQPWFIGLIELQALTGVRIGEIRTARWEWVRPDGLELPDTKTGARVIMLSTFARDVLASIPRVQGNPYIIAGRGADPLKAYAKRWRQLLRDAGITDLRTHDLRRFFASAGLSEGLALDTVGNLLGHSNPTTTKRYAYLMTADAQAAAELASARVRAMMTKGC